MKLVTSFVFAISFISLVLLVVPAKSSASTYSCNCVAFRLDDVQDYYLNDVQVAVIDVFIEKNASLTIGIIGNYFGEDERLLNYIKEKTAKDRLPMVELASHGWNHEDFTSLTEAEQSQLIKKNNEKINRLFGVNPVVFIPPFNAINGDTLKALEENRIRYLSANVTSDPPPYTFVNSSLYRFPETADTGNLNDDNTYWHGESHEKTFSDIEKSLMDHGFAVVMMHPMEFSLREDLKFENKVYQPQLRELELLIDKIQAKGIKIVPVSMINQDHNLVQSESEFLQSDKSGLILIGPAAIAVYFAVRMKSKKDNPKNRPT